MTDPTGASPNAVRKPRGGFPKWLWFALGGIVAVAVAVVWLIFAMTAPAVDAANKFLEHVGNGRVEQAYKDAAPLFRQRQSLEAFRKAAMRFGMDKYESASWSSRELSGSRTILKGEITLRGGGRLPAQVGLIKIGETWRVYGMTFPSGGVSSSAVPPRAELEALAQRSLLDFNDAVQRKNFTAFHAKLSAPMRKKYSVEQIQGVFHVFIARNIDIAGIRQEKPQFDPAPRRDSDGSLYLKGRYPTRPSEVQFELRYIKEAGQWRLITINVNLRPAS